MDAPSTRVQRRPVHGVLLLDKPLGLSSNDALQKAKWLLRAEKAGHTGTLDPLASGVLPLCFGAATKFSHLQLGAHKTYLARLKLGATTATGDAEGEVLLEREVQVDEARIEAVLQAFRGRIRQMPPMYSALKKDGKPLYEYARQGIEVVRENREIEILRLTRSSFPGLPQAAFDELDIEVECSKGTYIRSLAVDIGEALGCGAHLSGLRRAASGQFGIDRCIGLPALEAMLDAARLQLLLPVDALLAGLPSINLEPHEAGRFLSGLRRRGAWPDCAMAAVYGPPPLPGQSKALLGAAHVAAGELIPDRLLNPQEIEQMNSTQSTPA
jgi:tRNA pseudouridine55 synthase